MLVEDGHVLQRAECPAHHLGQELEVDLLLERDEGGGLGAGNVPREAAAGLELAAQHLHQGVAEGGAEDACFSYYITATREGFEEHEPIQQNKHFTADGASAGEFENRYTEDTLDNRAIRSMLKSNGILTADGRLNMDTVARLGWTVKADDAEQVSPETSEHVYASEQTANGFAAD